MLRTHVSVPVIIERVWCIQGIMVVRWWLELWLGGDNDGDHSGQLSLVQAPEPCERVWMYPEDESSHPRVLSKGRTDVIYILNASLALTVRMVQRLGQLKSEKNELGGCW